MWGRCSVSKTILAGWLSVTHMRDDANPGRAGSMRTSGDGPSSTRLDLPGSRSIVTILLAGFTPPRLLLHPHDSIVALG